MSFLFALTMHFFRKVQKSRFLLFSVERHFYIRTVKANPISNIQTKPSLVIIFVIRCCSFSPIKYMMKMS
jgi:hypothetical protein